MLHSVCTQVKIKMGVIHCFIILSLVLFNVFCLRLSDKSAPKHVSCMEHCMTIYPNQVLNYVSHILIIIVFILCDYQVVIHRTDIHN